ncbi:hypothetical protein LWF01_02360 [Saxibacter everestensis]|uniref:Uncharacterized protein n=1 Tax=Saxibacter everestensis TaxID=2909229 RepID=A0ABY8QUC3_9MICO|nr:hypothetical protein LWF01_02360 [Brevibacteriaceae bacterium ZFBP1038]
MVGGDPAALKAVAGRIPGLVQDTTGSGKSLTAAITSASGGAGDARVSAALDTLGAVLGGDILAGSIAMGTSGDVVGASGDAIAKAFG